MYLKSGTAIGTFWMPDGLIGGNSTTHNAVSEPSKIKVRNNAEKVPAILKMHR
jgi:hypothetical protein